MEKNELKKKNKQNKQTKQNCANVPREVLAARIESFYRDDAPRPFFLLQQKHKLIVTHEDQGLVKVVKVVLEIVAGLS